MDLIGKKLLLMGGGAFAKDLKKYSDEKGFIMIAVGKDPSRLRAIAHETYEIDTQDVDALEILINEKNIDGIFVGTTEVNIPPAIELAKRTRARFYITKEHWKMLFDKAIFKEMLKKYHFPIIPEYEENSNYSEIEFPVIVKPVDSSGGNGITVCHNVKELSEAILHAKSFSLSNKVIIEKYMENMSDTFIRYHFQNGVYSISSSFDKMSDFSQNTYIGMPLIYTHPSKHLDTYVAQYDLRMQKIFSEIGIKDGVMTLQGFVDDDKFYFYEAGYRLGGSQSYIFTDAVNSSNSLYYMINYALTGNMSDYLIKDRDNPFMKKACCNLYIALKGGIITQILGKDKICSMKGVLNLTEFYTVGSTIYETGSLSQVCMRIHLMADTWFEMDKLLNEIDDKLQIFDENGCDMKMRHVRCISDIEAS